MSLRSFHNRLRLALIKQLRRAADLLSEPSPHVWETHHFKRHDRTQWVLPGSVRHFAEVVFSHTWSFDEFTISVSQHGIAVFCTPAKLTLSELLAVEQHRLAGILHQYRCGEEIYADSAQIQREMTI
jgi:hypothetical protein